MGLMLNIGRRDALSGGAPAALGCSIEGGRMLFLGGLPLRGTAGRNLFLGELPLRGAA